MMVLKDTYDLGEEYWSRTPRPGIIPQTSTDTLTNELDIQLRRSLASALTESLQEEPALL